MSLISFGALISDFHIKNNLMKLCDQKIYVFLDKCFCLLIRDVQSFQTKHFFNFSCNSKSWLPDAAGQKLHFKILKENSKFQNKNLVRNFFIFFFLE